ncbi:MAG: acetyltransferase [Desulfovibrio sp.]
MKEILIYGASGHGSVVLDIVEKSGQYTVAGFIDDGAAADENNREFYGYPILGGIDTLCDILQKRDVAVVMGIGSIPSRKVLVEKILSAVPDCQFPPVIHPTAVIARDVQVGQGTVICANAVLNTAANVGEFCIINTAAVIEHDCSVGNWSMINPNAALGGNTHIGEQCQVCLGASIIHGINVGDNSTVASGATCVRDVPENTVVMGTPARPAPSS